MPSLIKLDCFLLSPISHSLINWPMVNPMGFLTIYTFILPQILLVINLVKRILFSFSILLLIVMLFHQFSVVSITFTIYMITLNSGFEVHSLFLSIKFILPSDSNQQWWSNLIIRLLIPIELEYIKLIDNFKMKLVLVP